MSSAPAAPTPTYPRAPSPYFFRRRTLGRAPSPPTWACYEQINSEYGGEFSCSDSDSCDDDDDECAHDHKHDEEDDDDEHSCSEDGEDYAVVSHGATDVESMDVDEAGDAEKKAHEHVKAKSKGKAKSTSSGKEKHERHTRKRVSDAREWEDDEEDEQVRKRMRPNEYQHDLHEQLLEAEQAGAEMDLEEELEDDDEDEEIEDLDRVLPADVTTDEAFEEEPDELDEG